MVHCNKSLVISVVYLTASQPDLCIGLILCEEAQLVSNPHYLHGVKQVIESIRGKLCVTSMILLIRTFFLQDYVTDAGPSYMSSTLVIARTRLSHDEKIFQSWKMMCPDPMDETSDQLLR